MLSIWLRLVEWLTLVNGIIVQQNNGTQAWKIQFVWLEEAQGALDKKLSHGCLLSVTL